MLPYLASFTAGALLMWLVIKQAISKQAKELSALQNETIAALKGAQKAKEAYEAGLRSLPIDGICHRRAFVEED